MCRTIEAKPTQEGNVRKLRCHVNQPFMCLLGGSLHQQALLQHSCNFCVAELGKALGEVFTAPILVWISEVWCGEGGELIHQVILLLNHRVEFYQGLSTDSQFAQIYVFIHGNNTITISYFLGSTQCSNCSPSFFSCKLLCWLLKNLSYWGGRWSWVICWSPGGSRIPSVASS